MRLRKGGWFVESGAGRPVCLLSCGKWDSQPMEVEAGIRKCLGQTSAFSAGLPRRLPEGHSPFSQDLAKRFFSLFFPLLLIQFLEGTHTYTHTHYMPSPYPPASGNETTAFGVSLRALPELSGPISCLVHPEVGVQWDSAA